jgi:hypothetical protein
VKANARRSKTIPYRGFTQRLTLPAASSLGGGRKRVLEGEPDEDEIAGGGPISWR